MPFRLERCVCLIGDTSQRSSPERVATSPADTGLPALRIVSITFSVVSIMSIRCYETKIILSIVAKDVNLHKEKNQYSLLTRSSIFLCNFIKIGYLSRAMLRMNTIGRPVQNSVIKFVTPHSGSSLSMGSSRMLSAQI